MLNKVTYQGRLTKDPELKHTQSDVPNVLFTIAWSEKYKETETKCFLLCKAWRQTAEFISKYFRKGQEIVIDGHMVTENWTKEGEENNQVTLCIIDKAHFCGPKTDADRQETPPPAPDNSFVEIPDNADEELPFT